MPPVKKKGAAKKPLLERLRALTERYTIASLAGSTILAGVIALVLWAGGYFGMASRAVDRAANKAAVAAGLEVRRVLLRGAHETAHEEILTALGPALGASLAHFPLEAARQRIENIGWVRAAAVTRLYPDTIAISLREREPAAMWQLEGDLHLVDAEGAVIRPVSAYEYSYLPLIVGSGAPEAASGVLQAIARHDEFKNRIRALIRVGERRWDLRLDNEATIRLPETDYARAIDDLALLQAAQQTLDQPIEYIDLRDPERMVMRKRGAPDPGAAGKSGDRAR
jgi:cell division protein FtsQ